MSTLGLIPNFAITNGATGEVAEGDLTKMGLYVGLLGPDMQMKMVEFSQMGSKALALGSSYIAQNDLETKQAHGKFSENTLHIYFYKSNGNPTTSDGKLPSFMNPDLTVNEAMITAYVSNKTKTEDIASVKEGLIVERRGVFNLLGTISGITAKWGTDYGIGEFDSVCVSVVDLHKLKDNISISSDETRQPLFAGTMYGVDTNALANSTDICYIKNGINGITAENEILIKKKGKPGLLTVNLDTGDITAFNGTYDGYMAIWGTDMVEIDGIFYGLTNGVKGTDAELPSYSSTCYLFSYNPTTGKSVVSSASYTYNENMGLLKVGSLLYANIKSRNYTSTSTTYKPEYRPVNLSTLAITGTALSMGNLPAVTNSGSTYRIANIENNYLFHDNKNLISYRFTDLADIESSITEVYFVGCGTPITRTIGELEYSVFLAAVLNGFYEVADTSATPGVKRIFRNTGYKGMKYMLLDGEVGPLMSYGTFGVTYDKTSSVEFTFDYYIAATSI